MQVYLGSDHAGFNLKKQIKAYLVEKFNGKDGFSVLDLGVFTNDATDYPDIAREVCEKVVENKVAMGILICGSGVGMSISANRLKGIRAVLANNEMTAQMSRAHNDVNVLCMGERMTPFDAAKGIVDTFLETKFDAEERHVRRIGKIETVGSKDAKIRDEEGRC
jgi:ribose 5-phosphate isomerase B